MSVSCSGERERKADKCRLRTWSWRILHPCGVLSMKGRPLLWSGNVESLQYLAQVFGGIGVMEIEEEWLICGSGAVER